MKLMTTKQAMEILKKNGLIVTEREAEIILDFLSMLAEISCSDLHANLIETLIKVRFQAGGHKKARFLEPVKRLIFL